MRDALVGTGSFIVALVGCEVVRRVAVARRLLDVANDRSLHTVPTPRLGGLPIVVAVLLAGALAWSGLDFGFRVLIGIGGVVALVGLRDDLKPLSAKLRILIQLLAAAAFIAAIGAPPLLLLPDVIVPLPVVVVGVVWVVWLVGVLNITNFMDGMDGLAGAQIAFAGAFFAFFSRTASHSLAWALAGASLGFLSHNFPPARIFLGDAGSTFTGFVLAGMAVLGTQAGVPLAQSALVLAPFLLDGTFTIVRRLSRREKIWEAHRSHLYQRAVQSGLGHREVLLVYLAWMVVSWGCALTASTPTGIVLGWAAALVGLYLVWRWVHARELKSA